MCALFMEKVPHRKGLSGFLRPSCCLHSSRATVPESEWPPPQNLSSLTALYVTILPIRTGQHFDNSLSEKFGKVSGYYLRLLELIIKFIFTKKLS